MYWRPYSANLDLPGKQIYYQMILLLKIEKVIWVGVIKITNNQLFSKKNLVISKNLSWTCFCTVNTKKLYIVVKQLRTERCSIGPERAPFCKILYSFLPGKLGCSFSYTRIQWSLHWKVYFSNGQDISMSRWRSLNFDLHSRFPDGEERMALKYS